MVFFTSPDFQIAVEMVDWISAKALQFLPEYPVFEDLFQEHSSTPVVIFLSSLGFL